MRWFTFLLVVVGWLLSLSGVGGLAVGSVWADSTTLYLGNVERTFDDAGNIVSEKTYLVAGQGIVLRTNNIQQPTNNKIEYLYADLLSSTVLVTDSSGSKIATTIYYPYGNDYLVNPQPETRNSITDKQYTSQRKDFSSDLYFYNARYYNPQTGKFISADKAQGPNRYAYVSNNPIMRNDPSGLMDMAETQGGGGGAGAPCTKCHTQPKPVYQDDYENYCRADGSGCGRNQKITYTAQDWQKALLVNAIAFSPVAIALAPEIIPPALSFFSSPRGQQVVNALDTIDVVLSCGQNLSSPECAQAVGGIPGLPGTKFLDDYGSLLGEGAFGKVYGNLQTGIATKIYNTGLEARMLAEGKLLQEWGGGLLPKFHGFVPGGFQMELIEGEELFNLGFFNHPPMKVPADVISRTRQQLVDLGARGFVHRDIHSGNVMVVKNNGQVAGLRMVDPLAKVPGEFDPRDLWTAADDLDSFNMLWGYYGGP